MKAFMPAKWYVFKHWLRGKRAEFEIRPGDIYEDCAYHPVLCTENYLGDLVGISLIDGTQPRVCSMFGCGPVKMTIEEALESKHNEVWKKGEDVISEYWENNK